MSRGAAGWRPTRWWRRLGLRPRLILIGAAGLAAGLALGGAVLLAALGFALQTTVDSEARATARDVAALAAAGPLPDPLPVAGRQIVQVVDAEHRVLAGSINADRMVPLLYRDELVRAREHGPRYLDGDRVGVDGPLRVLTAAVGDGRTVIVARPVAELRRGVDLLRTALLVTYPPLVAGLAALAWRVVGAALRPVEQLRAGAEAITGAEAGGGGAGGEAAGGAGSEAGGGAGAGRLPVPEPRDEIHRLATTLNDMLDRLAAARDRQRVFVADAAHELRSPIASIRTQLEVAQRLGDIDPQLAADLLADADRLYRLVADLLLLARADEGAPVAPPRPVELGGLLRDVARRYAGGRLPVTVVPAPPAWTRGDPGGLDRVLTNLVDNAVRHAVGRVELAVAVDGGFHLVTVVDDGPGVPDADRERVFDRFTRLDDARARDSGGAGLGLAIVAELVRRHGGSVRLADAGPGLRVELRLPATDGDEPA